MSANESDETEPNENYAYIHILPEKTGDQATRDIVPTSILKKFDLSAYKSSAKTRNQYKSTIFKFRNGPGGKKQKCFVLYVGDTFEDVQHKSLTKRFSPPAYSNTLSNDSSADSTELQKESTQEEVNTEVVTNKKRKKIDKQNKNKDDNEEFFTDNELGVDSQVDDDIELVKNAKKQRKAQSKTKEKNKRELNQSVLDAYLEQNSENEDPVIQASSTPVRTSFDTSQKDKIIHDQAIKIKQLEYQLSQVRRDARNQMNSDAGCHVDGSDGSEESECNRVVSTLSKKDMDPFCVHDKIYGFTKDKLDQNIQLDADGNIHIGLGVYCNPVAYNDSFKTKNPYKCLSLLTEGVYGLEDLSTRCVRKQKNTRNKRELSPIKKMAIEKQVYCFMRVKDKTISQVDDFLNDLNQHHHKVITSATARHLNAQQLRLQDEESERIRLQEEEDERIRLQEEENERIRLQNEARIGLNNEE